ncbi:Ppx/GppA phosphatase family protein [Candidatus Riflebacteria bacterium]
MQNTIAVIDFGTHAARLLISRKRDQPTPKVIFSKGQTHNISGDLKHGKLGQKGRAEIKSILQEFLTSCKEHQIKKPFLIATSLFRRIHNSTKLFTEFEASIDVKILSREEEARYAFLGAMFRSKKQINSEHNYALVDQGGGSTELVFGSVFDRGVLVNYEHSLPFGMKIPLLKRTSGKQNLKDLQKELQLILKRLVPSDELLRLKIDKLFALGSSIKKIFCYSLFQKGMTWEYEQIKFHGAVVTMDDLNKIEKELILMGFDKFAREVPAEFDGFQLFSGVQVFKKLLSNFRCDSITIAGWGLRFGIILEKFGSQIVYEG